VSGSVFGMSTEKKCTNLVQQTYLLLFDVILYGFFFSNNQINYTHTNHKNKSLSW